MSVEVVATPAAPAQETVAPVVAAAATPAAPATPADNEPVKKVYVGNISFRTREPDLSHHFESCGKVVRALIMCRGPRSLGYGFVEFETAEAATAAVATLHGKDLGGRQLVVELARAPRPRTAVRPIKPRQVVTQRPLQQPQQTQQQPKQQQAAPQQGFQQFPQQYGFVPRQPRRGGRPQQPQPMMMYAFPASGPRNVYPVFSYPPQQQMQPYMQQPVQQRPQRQPQQHQFPPQQPQQAQQQPQAQQPQAQQQLQQRKRLVLRPRRNNQQQQQLYPVTNATMYVGNLPFIVEDANLREIFKDLQIKDARVMRVAGGRSLGYGFVEFESPEARQRAFNTLDKVEVEGRVLALKPAVSRSAAAPVPTTV